MQIGLGITLISADAVAAELEAETIEEWRYGPLPFIVEWHLVAREGGSLPAGAHRLLEHLATAGPGRTVDPGRLAGDSRAPVPEELHLTDEGMAVIASRRS